MNLKDAMLCLDCDELGLKATHCPLCASRTVVDLSKWIKPRDQTAEKIGKARNVLMHEVEEMKSKIEFMMADVEMSEEPLGCGA